MDALMALDEETISASALTLGRLSWQKKIEKYGGIEEARAQCAAWGRQGGLVGGRPKKSKQSAITEGEKTEI